MLKRLFCLIYVFFISLNVFAQDYRIENNKDSLLYYLKQESSVKYPDAGVEVFYEIGTVEQDLALGFSYKYEISFKVYNKEAVGSLLDNSRTLT